MPEPLSDPFEAPPFPLFLRLSGMRCLVVGGTQLALEKAQALVRSKGHVVVVASAFIEGFRDLDVQLENRRYEPGEAGSFRIVVAATGIAALDQQVARDAIETGAIVNVVDDRHASNFFSPAIVRRGDLQIAISTNGRSPAFARFLRDKCAQLLDDDIEATFAIVSELRDDLKRREVTTVGHDWQSLIAAASSARHDGGDEHARAVAKSLVSQWSSAPKTS